MLLGVGWAMVVVAVLVVMLQSYNLSVYRCPLMSAYVRVLTFEHDILTVAVGGVSYKININHINTLCWANSHSSSFDGKNCQGAFVSKLYDAP